MNAKLRINSPCKDCKSRYIGCHDECANYKEFRSKKDELNKALQEGKHKASLVDEYKVNETIRLVKRKGGRRWL